MVTTKFDITLKLFYLGSVECVKRVVAKGGDINFRDDRKKKAYDYAKIGATEQPDAYAKVLGLDYAGVVEVLKDFENSTGK